MDSQIVRQKLANFQLPCELTSLFDGNTDNFLGCEASGNSGNMLMHDPGPESEEHLRRQSYGIDSHGGIIHPAYYEIQQNALASDMPYRGARLTPRYVNSHDNVPLPPPAQSQTAKTSSSPSPTLATRRGSRQSQRSNGSSTNMTIKKASTQGTRKRISPEQTQILEKSFREIPRPGKEMREDLAKKTGLPVKNIQIWFQNRRAKAKAVNETSILKLMSTTTSNNNNSTTSASSKNNSQWRSMGSSSSMHPKNGPVFVNTDINMSYHPGCSDAALAALQAANVGIPVAPFISEPPRHHLRHQIPYFSGIASSTGAGDIYDGTNNQDWTNSDDSYQRRSDMDKCSNIVSQVIQVPVRNYYKGEFVSSRGGVLQSPFPGGSSPLGGGGVFAPNTGFEDIPSPLDAESWNMLMNGRLNSDDSLLTPVSTINKSPGASPFVSSSPSVLKTPMDSAKEPSSSASSFESLSTINTGDSMSKYYEGMSSNNNGSCGYNASGIHYNMWSPAVRKGSLKTEDANLLSYPPNIGDNHSRPQQQRQQQLSSFGWARNGIKSATESTFVCNSGGTVSSPLRPLTPPVMPQNLRRSVSTSGIQKRVRTRTRMSCNEELEDSRPAVASADSLADNTIRAATEASLICTQMFHNKDGDDSDNLLDLAGVSSDIESMEFLRSSPISLSCNDE